MSRTFLFSSICLFQPLTTQQSLRCTLNFCTCEIFILSCHIRSYLKYEKRKIVTSDKRLLSSECIWMTTIGFRFRFGPSPYLLWMEARRPGESSGILWMGFFDAITNSSHGWKIKIKIKKTKGPSGREKRFFLQW